MSRTIFEGPIASKTKETDGGLFIPADRLRYTVGTWAWNRVAAGDYVMRKTAGDNTSIIICDLNSIFFSKYGQDPTWDAIYGTAPSSTPNDVAHDIRGIQLRSIDFIYRIETAALDAHSAALMKTVLANNVAPAVTTPSTMTGTLATAAQATHPYVTNLVVDTPFILGANAADVQNWLEWTINAAATSAVDVYGIYLKFHYNLL